MKIFFSYSHKDEAVLERLRTHLAPLRREGRLDEWFDRDIQAGGDIDAEITENLETADLFVLLISPDFLDSEYCVEKEMNRANQRRLNGDAEIVPIILEPCDWQNTFLKDLKVLPKDGQPISKWKNKNDAYLDIVQNLRQILDSGDKPKRLKVGETATGVAPAKTDASRYRIMREFDEIDRSDFRTNAFVVIRDYFERAVSELNTLENLRGRFKTLSDASFTCTIVNKFRKDTACITVQEGGGSATLGDITYSFVEHNPLNTSNGYIAVESDE